MREGLAEGSEGGQVDGGRVRQDGGGDHEEVVLAPGDQVGVVLEGTEDEDGFVERGRKEGYQLGDGRGDAAAHEKDDILARLPGDAGARALGNNLTSLSDKGG